MDGKCITETMLITCGIYRADCLPITGSTFRVRAAAIWRARVNWTWWKVLRCLEGWGFYNNGYYIVSKHIMLFWYNNFLIDN